MTLETVDWKELGGRSGADLRGAVFSLFQEASTEIQRRSGDDPVLLGLVPRLAALIEQREELSEFRELQGTLARSLGLWNYIDKSSADSRDELVAEIATVDGLGIALHKEQVAALNALFAGQNLILSAPTSFGKSILIDALLLDGRYKRIAIVLPTIALLDEFRRRLVRRFGDTYDVLMHHSERASLERVIFLGTQERLINRDDLGYLDLAVVDEFYKLDARRRDDRSVTLNAAVYKLLHKSRQFFFLGPNIENVSVASDNRWRFTFLRTRFSTVAVDTFNLAGVADKKTALLEESYREGNWPALVFASAPDKANELANEFLETGAVVGDGKPLAQWMTENYGATWELSEAVAAGIGVHHGRIPRALASRFVKEFNDKRLPILICTSTLIEGVNTAAKSVLIYDKKINAVDYDFFTFANIRGRAGRLGQHHVGNVFLFNNPPGHEDVEVSAPLFGDIDDAPDEYVVHVAEDDTSGQLAERVAELTARLGMTAEELRRFSSIGVDDLEAFKSAVDDKIQNPSLVWGGWPRYNQIKAVCEVICAVKRPQRAFGCASASQLTMYLNKLRTNLTLKAFFAWHSSTYRGAAVRVDNVFKFLRAAEYSLPEYFAVVEMFLKKKGLQPDYALFLAEMPRWFRAEALKILEEQGVPIQISERFLRSGDSVTSLGNRLRNMAEQSDRALTVYERQWIIDALPRR